ncbi:MAG: hypothetical protein K5648_07615, partial [Erysipelotrichaceae bacterium]|nr:hypothetical protein [Erysipelotrichaceae bacterium]
SEPNSTENKDVIIEEEKAINNNDNAFVKEAEVNSGPSEEKTNSEKQAEDIKKAAEPEKPVYVGRHLKKK